MGESELLSGEVGDGRAVAADTEPSQVLVVGFRGLLGAGLRDVIGGDAALRAVLADGATDLFGLIGEQRPEVALIWYAALSSVVELRKLVLAHPATRIVVAVPREDRERDDALACAGVVVLPITVERDELRAALRLLARGVVGPPRPAGSHPAAGLGLLTGRETEVLDLLARRRSAVEVAEALHVSVATVNSHRYRIYEKLGVHSRRDLALYAEELAGAAEEQGRARGVPAAARDQVAYRRVHQQPREHDRAVVIDFCQALGARRWLGHGG